MAERIMLNINHIAKTFNPGTITEKRALTDVDLKLNEGDFVTIIGGNGAGKSTTLNAVAGVFAVDKGTIEVDGVDVTRLPEYKRAKLSGARVPGSHDRHGGNHEHRGEYGAGDAPRRKAHARAGAFPTWNATCIASSCARWGWDLEDRMSSKVGLLSGGQRQALTLLMAALQHAEAPSARRAYRRA